MTQNGPPGPPWWKDKERLERERCRKCDNIHCCWCGLPFITTGTQRHPAAPTREHVDARHEDGKRVRSGRKRVAHALCNTLRGHERWVFYHSETAPSDHQLEMQAKLIERMFTYVGD